MHFALSSCSVDFSFHCLWKRTKPSRYNEQSQYSYFERSVADAIPAQVSLGTNSLRNTVKPLAKWLFNTKDTGHVYYTTTETVQIMAALGSTQQPRGGQTSNS